VAIVSVLAPGIAAAQPVAPPAGEPVATPPVVDDIDAQVAAGLLARARELRSSGELVAARELASEAADRDPAGATGAAARALMDEIDEERRAKMPAFEPAPEGRMLAGAPPPSPAGPVAPAIEAPAPARARRGGRAWMAGYGAIGGAAIGLGVAGTDEDAAAGAIGGAAVGGITGYYLARRGDWTATRAHHVGAGVLWGAAAGAAFADVVTGTTGSTEDDIAAGAGIGAIGGAVIAGALATGDRLSADAAALVHSVTAWGLLGGLSTAVAIDPPEGEAYSLNAAIGIAAGYTVGQLAARRTELSSRRLARVNALALLGAGVPLAIWRATDDSAAITDEGGGGSAWGLAATAGLVGGVYLGLRWTRGMDRVATSTAAPGPVALLSRDGAGGWTTGGLGLTPARHGRGATLTLVGGAW
jgi:hypothetical protein